MARGGARPGAASPPSARARARAREAAGNQRPWAGPPALTFRPTGYARQLEEFKEASDEWLRRIVSYALSEQG
jgi:hypothetical protein